MNIKDNPTPDENWASAKSYDVPTDPVKPEFTADTVTTTITEGTDITSALPVGQGGTLNGTSSSGTWVTPGAFGGAVGINNPWANNRTLLSTNLVGGVVEKIYSCTPNFTLAVWPPRDDSWYEKETWAPINDTLILVSTVKGLKVPEHFEWEDDINAV